MRRTKYNRWRDCAVSCFQQDILVLHCTANFLGCGLMYLLWKCFFFFWCQLFLGYTLQSITSEKRVLCLESLKKRKKLFQLFSPSLIPIPILSHLSHCCQCNKELKSNSQCGRLTKTAWRCNGGTFWQLKVIIFLSVLYQPILFLHGFKQEHRKETFPCCIFLKEKQTWDEVHVLWLSHKRIRLLCYLGEKPRTHTLPLLAG